MRHATSLLLSVSMLALAVSIATSGPASASGGEAKAAGPRPLTVAGLSIVDDDGEVVGSLTQVEGKPLLTLSDAKSGSCLLAMPSQLSLTREGFGSVILQIDASGIMSLRLEAPGERQPRVVIGGRASGEPTMSSILLCGEDGKPGVGIHVMESGLAFAGVGEPDGANAVLCRTPDGQAMVGVKDEHGEASLRSTGLEMK